MDLLISYIPALTFVVGFISGLASAVAIAFLIATFANREEEEEG